MFWVLRLPVSKSSLHLHKALSFPGAPSVPVGEVHRAVYIIQFTPEGKTLWVPHLTQKCRSQLILGLLSFSYHQLPRRRRVPVSHPAHSLTSYLRPPLRWPREILGGPARGSGQGNPICLLIYEPGNFPNSSQKEDCSGNGLECRLLRPVGEGGAGGQSSLSAASLTSTHPSLLGPGSQAPPLLTPRPLHHSSALGRFPVSASWTSKSDGQSRERVSLSSTSIQTLRGRTLNRGALIW